ncbi:hypothetical protein R50072_06100 [Simiduia litorea]
MVARGKRASGLTSIKRKPMWGQSRCRVAITKRCRVSASQSEQVIILAYQSTIVHGAVNILETQKNP